MNLYQHFRRWLILSFALIYLINYFFHSPTMALLNSVILLIIIIQAVPQLPKATLIISLGLFIIGGTILALTGGTLVNWLTAISKNAGLVTLFITVPLLGLPLFYEDYQKQLLNVAQRYMSSIMSFCLLTAVVIHLLGTIISIGSVPLVYELFKGNAELYRARKPFLASMMQAYMATGFWSPAWASVAVVTTGLGIPWLKLVPIGILLAVISIALSLFFTYLEIRRTPKHYANLIPDPSITVNWHHIYILSGLIASFILAIVVLDLLTSWEVLVIIPIVAVFFPLFSGLFQNKIPQFKKGMAEYYNISVIRVKNEVVLFTAAGFLGKALEFSGVSTFIPQLLPPWLYSHPLISIFFLMLTMIIISLTGIHPVVTGTALVGAINPVTLGLLPFVFGLTILTGWAIAILVTPFSGVNLIMGGLENTPSWNISLGISGFYGCIMLIIMSFILSGLQLVL